MYHQAAHRLAISTATRTAACTTKLRAAIRADAVTEVLNAGATMATGATGGVADMVGDTKARLGLLEWCAFTLCLLVLGLDSGCVVANKGKLCGGQ